MSLVWSEIHRRATLSVTAAWYDNDVDHEYEENLRDNPHETNKEKGQRWLAQVKQAHGVGDEVAKKAITATHGHAMAGDMEISPKEAGFASAGHDRHGHYSIPMSRKIMSPETWKNSPVQHISLQEPVHATQSYLNPEKIRHNLFHPNKTLPYSEREAVGDPDYDPHWDQPDEEDHGESSPEERALEDHPRFVRRHSGDLEVADGHHRVAADLMLGKTHTMGKIVHERELQ